MMNLLPTAARIGFTGTPLLSSDNITARTFGGYVSVYDFKRAVEDGATVPLYYENRGEKLLDLRNPDITEKILEAIEKADLSIEEQEKLEAEFAKEIHILTAEPRLKSIAKAKISELDHWTDKQETKAAVDNLIRDTLWAELPECYDEVSISMYRQKIYEYVYTRYKEAA